MVSNPEDLDIY